MEATAFAMTEQDWVEYWLGLWSRWMQHGEHHRHGYPPRSAVLATGGYSKSSDEMQADVDMRAVEAVDAAICSLTMSEQCAVRAIWLHEVWRFPREPRAVIYARAVAKLALDMRKRNVH